jgi:hypothetical protein
MRRILNIATAEIGLSCPRVVAIVGELVEGVQHVGMRLDVEVGHSAACSTMREKSGADSGAARSETNTKGNDGLSR